MTASRPLGPDTLDAPADRFCDIVMEGGVTSGIIYAAAVVELARHYRFRNIGGSSIGAFAAALAAAAEYRRRQGHGDGFEALASLPEKLAEAPDEAADAKNEKNKCEDEQKKAKKKSVTRTRLESLFQPQPKTQRLFRIFLSTLERGGAASALACGLRTALCQYKAFWLPTAVVLVLVALVAPVFASAKCLQVLPSFACLWPLLVWGVAGASLLILSTVVTLVVAIAVDFGSGVVGNGFGLCRGWGSDEEPDSADLAMFLHASIQQAAGRPLTDPPLTFRDLWDAPGGPAPVLRLPQASDQATRSINLEVYSSNLSHGRPYRFPLDERDDMGRLFFRVEDLAEYFPKGIVQFLAGVSRPYEPRSGDDPLQHKVQDGYREVPAADLPIMVAARLAMSFPVLISAVPLYAINHSTRSLEKCWMSDGGLCSNFPIHLFDSFLPMWPTFGISLSSRHSDQQEPVWLPEFHTSGRGELWDHGPVKSAFPFAAFLQAIWKTTWRWNDTTMMRMPGVRDRVVRIYLEPGEGGVNIRMPAERIRKLSSEYGTPAAKEFVRKFQAAGSPGWDEHRWVRLQTLLIALRERMRNFGAAADMDRHTTPIVDQIVAALTRPPLRKPVQRRDPLPSERPLDPEQAAELWALVTALRFLEQAFESVGDHDVYRALPRPSLRIRHPT